MRLVPGGNPNLGILDIGDAPNYLEHLGACEPVMKRLEKLDFHISLDSYLDVVRKQPHYYARLSPISQPPHCDISVSSIHHISRSRALLEAALMARLLWPEKFTGGEKG